MRCATSAGRKAETLGIWLCRVRVLSGGWRCSLGALCGLTVLSGVEGRVRDLPQAPPGAEGDSCASPAALRLGGTFPWAKGQPGTWAQSPPRDGAGPIGRDEGVAALVDSVSLRTRGKGLRQWSRSPPRALWVLGVGPRFRAGVLGVLGSDLEI